MKKRTLLSVLMMFLVLGCGKDSDNPVAPPTTVLASFQFENDLDGWDSGTHQSNFGRVTWNDREGGLVHMDGVGFDGLPNAWISNQVDLPASAKTLRTSTSAHDRGAGEVSLRIRLIDENQVEHTILDWDAMSTGDDGFDFVTQSFDISAYAGQTVTLYFEIGDIDGGGNNQRYIAYIEVHK